MGFLDQVSTTTEMAVTVLLPGFQAQCALPVMGMTQTYLNDDQKGVFTLKSVRLFGLEGDNPAASMTLDQLFVRKDQCHAIAFSAMLPGEHSGLMPRTERVVVYTSHYAIQGDFHMGADALVSDFIESSRAQFVGATNAQIFPLFRSRAAVIQHAPLVYVHRTAARMHHAI
jgi:hypothetical protein